MMHLSRQDINELAETLTKSIEQLFKQDEKEKETEETNKAVDTKPEDTKETEVNKAVDNQETTTEETTNNEEETNKSVEKEDKIDIEEIKKSINDTLSEVVAKAIANFKKEIDKEINKLSERIQVIESAPTVRKSVDATKSESPKDTKPEVNYKEVLKKAISVAPEKVLPLTDDIALLESTGVVSPRLTEIFKSLELI